MDRLFPSEAPIKSALFVDFDNIYIGLSKSDPAAAERFASDPARWLAWLEKGLPVRSDSTTTPRQRSILVRRCYPNPDAGFRRFRSFFTSAAFSVIDCPTLTRTGKNSSDIYMVMDILDILDHKTYFDEFIIFSGDSDFMPVLLRLRAHDRRTTTLAIDFMPPAFKAACDLVLSEEEFIEDALGVSHDSNCGGNGSIRGRVPVTLLKEMAARVYQVACEDGEVAGADLPDILKDFREFRESSNWLGFGTSQRLAEALVCSEQRLFLVRLNPMLYKLVLKPQVVHPEALPAEPASTPVLAQDEPKVAAFQSVSIKPADKPAYPSPVIEKGAHITQRSGDRPARAELARLRGQIIATVKDLVASSPNAILLARASQHVVTRLGPQVLETQWAGAGSFKRLLQSSGELGLEITTQPEPGYIFDPQLHTHPAQREHGAGQIEEEPLPEGEEVIDHEGAQVEEAPLVSSVVEPNPESSYLSNLHSPFDDIDDMDDEEEDEEEEAYEESLPPSLEEFARRVSQVTGAPDLSPHEYAVVFHGIVAELKEIAEGQRNYNTYQSSKTVSDWCAEHDVNISRGDLVLIFKGIIFQDGGRFGKRPGSYTAMELAHVVRNNIKALCRRSRMELSEYEEHLLDEWILGGLEDEAVGTVSFAAAQLESEGPSESMDLAQQETDEANPENNALEE